MMDTNKMREQFEAWAWKEYGQILWWGMNYSEVFKRNGERYLTEFLSVRWEAWQASRESVVVELPAEWVTNVGTMLPPPGVRRAIEAQGLKVKP